MYTSFQYFTYCIPLLFHARDYMAQKMHMHPSLPLFLIFRVLKIIPPLSYNNFYCWESYPPTGIIIIVLIITIYQILHIKNIKCNSP
jgi:hypothetical protein